MKHLNKTLLSLILISAFTITGCKEKTQQIVEPEFEQQSVSEIKTE